MLNVFSKALFVDLYNFSLIVNVLRPWLIEFQKNIKPSINKSTFVDKTFKKNILIDVNILQVHIILFFHMKFLLVY